MRVKVQYLTMAGTRGRFENGIWIETVEKNTEGGDEQPAGNTASTEDKVEELLEKAANSVDRAIDDVIAAGRTLFGTEKGREHIEKKARKAGEKLQKTIDRLAREAEKVIR